MGYSKSADNRAAASALASAQASTSVDDASSSRRSFLSRLSLPLRQRARNITDFYIRPAEPYKKYGAGDHVLGAVILTVVKPVRITHLTVALHGFVRVYKGPGAPANEPIVNPAEIPTNTGRGARQKSHSVGRVNLFEDEQTLSADGRLEPGRYEFNFELLFPSKGLPSSIDFERGTISYRITATLTRPPSITTKVDQRAAVECPIHLVERVDIGPLAPPPSRTIYLEPISKRSRKKRQPGPTLEQTTTTVSHDPPERSSDLDSTRANENSTDGSLSVVGDDQGHGPPATEPPGPPQSDVRSISGDSVHTSSTSPSRNGDVTYATPSAMSQSGKKGPTLKDRTITATVELLRGGCLAGDVVPVRISVQHIRQLKSMNGVIVTLYRLGRIDSAPSVTLSRELSQSQSRSDKEEIYPKSKTGLGGLSLSSAGSCSVFRKDLSQAIMPLWIDPVTMSTSLTTTIRVPEDVFPTIKGVPYEMITFKYHVEVLVDLGGKLAGQVQGGKAASGVRSSPGMPLGPTSSTYEAGSPSVAPWGPSIIDTDRLRREKGVISVLFELIVGTTDSSRLKDKGLSKLPTPVRSVSVRESDLHKQNGVTNHVHSWPASPEYDNHGPESAHQQDYPPFHTPYATQSVQQVPYWDTVPSQPPPPPPAPHYIPPPEVPDESSLNEKERIKRAEQRLLPSQPPEAPVAGPSNSSDFVNGENIYSADDEPSAPPNPSPATEVPSAPLEAPSAPTLDELSGGAGANSTEDKQELERRRLLAEASAPPDFPEDYEDTAMAGPSSSAPQLLPSAPPIGAAAVDFAPSAPVLDEEEHYGPQYAYATASPAVGQGSLAPLGEELPRYER
ncbi:putative pH-response regulator protein palF/rim-8 [Triangularia verruculosa]|uniref:PH-response regulator protein palF/rim-8 n=1 Tax=Triangularia verruculosa TaxID=2587418 RepID=A0AAN6XK57_9PEZI|nr:putative pH-response regulator protein palF/rim-8 [Triangularia verruculosa]